MKADFQFTGGRELERALAQLPRATAASVARRVTRKALKPVADAANDFWPGSSDDVFTVAPRVKRSQRARGKSASVVDMYVGAVNSPEAHLLEWGTGPRRHASGKYVGAVSPTPSLGPAWDLHRAGILRDLARGIGEEIRRTVARRAARGL